MPTIVLYIRANMARMLRFYSVFHQAVFLLPKLDLDAARRIKREKER